MTSDSSGPALSLDAGAGTAGKPVPVTESVAAKGGSPGQQAGRQVAGFGGEWFTPGRFALILAAFIFAAYPDVVLGGRTFFFRDFGFFGYPLAHYYRESFWRGEIPLWNPLNNCGLPFLAQWNTMVLYPGSLFYLFLPLSWSLAVFCLLHQFLAGLGMYFLAARWTGNRFAAGVAGLLFAFNGLSLNCLMWPNNISALGWMPWVVLSGDQAMEEGRRKALRAAIVGAMQMLAGAPEVILFTWAILALLLAARMSPPRPQRALRFGRFLAMILLVAALAAAQLLPFLQLLPYSQRAPGFGQSSWSMPGTGWANFLVPLFHCFSSAANQGVFFQYDQWWTSSYYAGIATWVWAGFAAWHAREVRVRLLTALTGVSIILALGDSGYLYHWLRQIIPQFDLLRYPIKFVVVALFSLPLLAAFGIARLQERAEPGCFRDARAFCLSWAGTVGLVAVILWFAWRHPFQWDEWPEIWKNALARLAYLTLCLVLAIAVQRAERPNLRRLLQMAVLLVIWLDFMTHTPRQNPTVSRAAYQPGLVRFSPAPAHGVSRAMISPAADSAFRSMAVSDGLKQYIGNRLGLFSNCNLLDDIPKLNGFFSLYLREADRVWELLYVSGNTNLSRLQDFLSVSRVTAPGSLLDWVTRTNFLPFVTAGQRPVFTDDPTALDSLAAPDFSPREVVYLPARARSAVRAGSATARVVSSRFTAQRGGIELEAGDRSLVVISQAFYPDWCAFLDDRPVPIWRANYAFQAVETTAGRHHLELVYRDRFFVFGIGVSVLTLLMCLVGLGISARDSVRASLSRKTLLPLTGDRRAAESTP
jgi:hypothetical protein